MKNMIWTKLFILSFLHLEQGRRLPAYHRGMAKQKKKSLNLSGLGSVSSSVASGVHH